jgi:hypothetical protein
MMEFAVTFLAAFCFAAAPLIGDVPMDRFELISSAGRAGVKALLQYLFSGKVGGLLGAPF